MELKWWNINFYYDSQNKSHLVANQMMDRKIKHIRTRYHFIKHADFDKRIKLVKIDKILNH